MEFLRFFGTMSSFTALGSVFYYTKNRDNQIYIVDNIEKVTKNIKNLSKGPLFFPVAPLPFTMNDISVPIEMLTDTNATKIYDNNFTIAIRNVYAYNPIIHSTKEVIILFKHLRIFRNNDNEFFGEFLKHPVLTLLIFVMKLIFIPGY